MHIVLTKIFILKIYINIRVGHGCFLLPVHSNSEDMVMVLTGFFRFEVTHIHNGTDKTIYFKSILVWSYMFAPANM